jgi:hypothetical protein
MRAGWRPPAAHRATCGWFLSILRRRRRRAPDSRRASSLLIRRSKRDPPSRCALRRDEGRDADVSRLAVHRFRDAERRGTSASRDRWAPAPSRELFHSRRRLGRWRAGWRVQRQSPVLLPAFSCSAGFCASLPPLPRERVLGGGDQGVGRTSVFVQDINFGASPRPLPPPLKGRGKGKRFTLDHIARRIG